MDAETLAMKAMLKFSPRVLENSIIVTEDEVLYHISPSNEIKEFVPRVVKRSMADEDETVARVCTAPTLLDALRGYAMTVSDFFKGVSHAAGNDDWRGGYYIYEIPAEVNIRPNEKLAPISKWCDERWLIDYKGKGQKYPCKIIGQVFYNKVTGIEDPDHAGINAGDFASVELYIKLDEVPKGLFPFSPDLLLGEGCHGVWVSNIDAYLTRGNLTKVTKHRKITLGEYYKGKKCKADLLSYSPPSYLDW